MPWATRIGRQLLLPGFVACRHGRRWAPCWAAVVVLDTIRAGGSWHDAADATGLPAGLLKRLAVQYEPALARIRPRIGQAARRAIIEDMAATQASLRELAERHGVAPDTVRLIAAEDAGLVPLERASKPKRCPECGYLIGTRRCLVCRARKYRAEHGQPDG